MTPVVDVLEIGQTDLDQPASVVFKFNVQTVFDANFHLQRRIRLGESQEGVYNQLAFFLLIPQAVLDDDPKNVSNKTPNAQHIENLNVSKKHTATS